MDNGDSFLTFAARGVISSTISSPFSSLCGLCAATVFPRLRGVVPNHLFRNNCAVPLCLEFFNLSERVSLSEAAPAAAEAPKEDEAAPVVDAADVVGGDELAKW